MKQNREIEVAIIGGGTAGLSCAIELKKLGVEDVVVFERASEAGGAPLHCGHKGFGIYEFKRVLTGPEYAKKLIETAEDSGVKIYLNHTLLRVEDGRLVTITNEGIKKFRAKRVLFAMGVRETPRSQRLVSGLRDIRIITTGSLQRFIYQKNRIPFKSSVIYGSEIVSFSALKTESAFGINTKAMIEEDDEIKIYPFIKPVAEKFFKTAIYKGEKNSFIEKGENLKIDLNSKVIEAEGAVFSGGFIPESAVLRESGFRYNLKNSSIYLSQDFQTSKRGFFAAGNIIRGAYASYKCYQEAKDAAKSIWLSLNSEEEPALLEIECNDKNIEWYYPSLINLNSPKKILTNIKFRDYQKGTLQIYLNDKLVYEKKIEAKPYKVLTLPWRDMRLKGGDSIRINLL